MYALAAAGPILEQAPEQTASSTLLARVRQGDRQAFRYVVEQYQDALAGTVVAMLGPSAEVDDVVQDTFIRFYKSIHRVTDDVNLMAYLKRIAINRSLDVLRRRKRMLARFISKDDDTVTFTEPTAPDDASPESHERVALVHRAIQSLPPKHRAVVVLRMIEGYSTQEAANMLDLPYGTVLSRLSRAQKKLKTVLAPFMQDDPKGTHQFRPN